MSRDRQLRVLHVIPAVARRYGGPSQAVLGMVRALRALNVAAEVVTTDADGPGGRLRVDLGRRVDVQGAPCTYFRRDWGEGLKFSRGLSAWLASHVVEYDVVHIHSVFSHSCVKAGKASWRGGVPYVVRPLGTLDPWGLGQKPWRKRFFWWLAARQLLRRANAVHYTSETERQNAERALGLSKGRVIPLGVCPPAEEAPEGGATLPASYCLALGRLHPVKNVESLIEAFHLLVTSGRAADWHLVLAGDGEAGYVSHLKTLAGRGPAGDRVHFLGWVEGGAKGAVLRRARLLALPSLQESFGMGAVEALWCGVPVLLSPGVHIAKELAEGGAGWITGATVRELATDLGELISNPARLERAGEKGRRLSAASYSWPAVAEKLRALYYDLSGRSLRARHA